MDFKVLKDVVFKVKWPKCASWKVKTNPKEHIIKVAWFELVVLPSWTHSGVKATWGALLLCFSFMGV